MSSSIALNSFVLYEMTLFTPSSMTYGLAATSSENADYFISLAPRLLGEKKQLCNVSDPVESHTEIDYYRYDIYQDLTKLALKDDITVVDVEQWYKKNKKRVRVVKDGYNRRLIAYGKRIYAIGANDLLKIVTCDDLPSNAVAFVQCSGHTCSLEADVQILCEDGSLCHFIARTSSITLSAKLNQSAILLLRSDHQLPPVFVSLKRTE